MSSPAAHERLARDALAEIVAVSSVGELVSATPAGEHLSTLAFTTTLPGYPRGRWVVTLAQLPDKPATVLETNLVPEA